MLRRILVISGAIISFHSSGALSQSTSITAPPTSSTQSTSPSQTSRPQLDSDSGALKFWKTNWHWFLIGFICALIPILLWAILGPGKRWYKARKYRSAQISWDRVGNERFQSPDMREVSGFSRSRGSGSSTSSRLALSLSAAAPGEREDLEAAAAIASPKLPSAYIQRERLMRNDSKEAVIGLVQPQIHSALPQSLAPPNKPADRNSTGSLGPPDPGVHRAHPKYNSFQRYSRQQRKRHMSMPENAHQNHSTHPSAETAVNTIGSLQESMTLLQTQIPHRKPVPKTQRDSLPSSSRMVTTQRIYLPQPPKATPYHIRQGSYQNDHNRSSSWHHTVYRGSVQTNPNEYRHASMDGYPPVTKPVPIPTAPAAPRRSTSRGRLQKPRHLNPQSHSHTHQKQPEPPREEPQRSFYRTPSTSRESLGRQRASSNPESIPDVPPLPEPDYPKAWYPPIRSAMSNKSPFQTRLDRVYGTDSNYSVSISTANPASKSVKFAALPPLSSSAPARLPVTVRHF